MKAGFGFQDFGETPFGLCLRVEDNRTVSDYNSERIYAFCNPLMIYWGVIYAHRSTAWNDS